MREPKKVRTIAELIKSCRMLREHNEKLKGRNSELEARLEISPDHDVDGIEARDETIKLLDDRIAELEAELTIKLLKDRIEELEARLEFKQKNTDALIARWEPYIKQLEEENQRLNDELEAIRKNHIATFPRIHSGFDVYDMSPAQKEGVIRDKLIEMGWIPPETLQAIRELPEKWRKYTFDNPEATSYIDSADCADELEEALGDAK